MTLGEERLWLVPLVVRGGGIDLSTIPPVTAAGGEADRTAREAGAVIPVGSVVTQLMGALVAQGHSGPDSGTLLRLVEQLSGRDEPTRSGSHG
jgi:hypothetical protein